MFVFLTDKLYARNLLQVWQLFPFVQFNLEQQAIIKPRRLLMLETLLCLFEFVAELTAKCLRIGWLVTRSSVLAAVSFR